MVATLVMLRPSAGAFVFCLAVIALACVVAVAMTITERYCSRVVTRLLAALGIAAVLAVMTAPVIAAENGVVMVNECAGYGLSDWQYWALSCWALPSK